MTVDPAVMAPVMGEPALPAFHSAGLDISPRDLNRVKERAGAEGWLGSSTRITIGVEINEV